jgi:DNA-binding transcriptional ArsR family regulator
MSISRRQMADQCVAAFDTAFFRALCEPARLAVLRELMVQGRADIAAVAENLPQDRSVVARHLRHLAVVGVVKSTKRGRHVFYEIDPKGVSVRMEGLLDLVREVQTAMKAISE